MNSSHEEMLDDVALYALGTLNAADAERTRAHLHECGQCRAEYEALTPAVTALGRSSEHDANERAASPLLKARLMREVRGTARHRVATWPAYAVAAASLAIAITSALYSAALTDRLHHAETTLAQEYATVQQDSSMVADLSNPHAQRIAVPGGEVVRVDGRLYLAMQDMPAAPHGKVYQAWTLPKGSKTMVPSVTFVPDRRGVALVPVSVNASNDAAVAVSVEPPGGSRQPTSAPVLLAHLE